MTTSTDKASHTPGPWEVAGSVIVLPNFPHDDICEVFNELDHTVTIPMDQARANAHLIAAAPEMLEALEECVLGFERCMKAGHCGQEFIDIKLAPAKAAIRKAKGEL